MFNQIDFCSLSGSVSVAEKAAHPSGHGCEPQVGPVLLKNFSIITPGTMNYSCSRKYILLVMFWSTGKQTAQDAQLPQVPLLCERVKWTQSCWWSPTFPSLLSLLTHVSTCFHCAFTKNPQTACCPSGTRSSHTCHKQHCCGPHSAAMAPCHKQGCKLEQPHQ